MIDISKGRYWDEGIELISGCSPCSPGCDHCWSAAQTNRFNKADIALTNQAHGFKSFGKFNGNLITHPERLKRFNARKPKVFAIWNDLFHEAVPDEFIDDVMLRMWHSDHTFLVLTKRAKRMKDYIKKECSSYAISMMENVYFGLTVCNQEEADEKIPIFLQVPGKRFLSIEPMLENIDLCNIGSPLSYVDALKGIHYFRGESVNHFHPINAVILGGETGPGARPMHPDWVRSVRNQCAAAGVPFFFKQWGEWWGDRKLITRTKQSVIMGDTVMHRVGRKNAGRELDGRTHDELPWVKK